MLLLKKHRDNIKITKNVVKAVARNLSGEAMIALLLNKRRDDVKITKDVVKAIARN